MTSRPGFSLKGMRFAAVNVLLASVYLAFVVRYWDAFLDHTRMSHLLLVTTSSLFFVFAIIRKDPKKVDHSPLILLVSTIGTIMPLALVPAGSNDHLIGQTLQLLGLCFQIAALVSLNRSFGALPAYRQVKSSGCYRIVRHPLYCAYTIGLVGFVINNPSTYNLFVVVLDTGLQLLRIRYEEGLLIHYQDYAVYTQKTKWRLIPLVW